VSTALATWHDACDASRAGCSLLQALADKSHHSEVHGQRVSDQQLAKVFVHMKGCAPYPLPVRTQDEKASLVQLETVLEIWWRARFDTFLESMPDWRRHALSAWGGFYKATSEQPFGRKDMTFELGPWDAQNSKLRSRQFCNLFRSRKGSKVAEYNEHLDWDNLARWSFFKAKRAESFRKFVQCRRSAPLLFCRIFWSPSPHAVNETAPQASE
jgi:hypothetical protein